MLLRCEALLDVHNSVFKEESMPVYAKSNGFPHPTAKISNTSFQNQNIKQFPSPAPSATNLSTTLSSPPRRLDLTVSTPCLRGTWKTWNSPGSLPQNPSTFRVNSEPKYRFVPTLIDPVHLYSAENRIDIPYLPEAYSLTSYSLISISNGGINAISAHQLATPP